MKNKKEQIITKTEEELDEMCWLDINNKLSSGVKKLYCNIETKRITSSSPMLLSFNK